MIPTVVLANTLNSEAVFGLKAQICKQLPDEPQCKSDF
jgi:hypothetical protein